MKKKSTLFLLFIFLFGCEANSNISSKSTSKEKPEYLQTDAHAALDRPYSQAVKVGNMLYLSGVIGRKPGETQLAAGGIVTTWKNEDPKKGGNIVCSVNKSLHNKMLKILKPVSK